MSRPSTAAFHGGLEQRLAVLREFLLCGLQFRHAGIEVGQEFFEFVDEADLFSVGSNYQRYPFHRCTGQLEASRSRDKGPEVDGIQLVAEERVVDSPVGTAEHVRVVINPVAAAGKVGLVFVRIKKWSTVFTKENALTLRAEVVYPANLPSRPVISEEIRPLLAMNAFAALGGVDWLSLKIQDIDEVAKFRAGPSIRSSIPHPTNSEFISSINGSSCSPNTPHAFCSPPFAANAA